MPESKRLTLIIDANNLAHYLDHLAPGQALSAEEIFRLAVHLANYAKDAQPPVTIELCFDPLPPETGTPRLPWVHILIAPPQTTADDLLRQRFRYYHHQGDPCYVITNDGEVRDDVEEEGGQILPAYDFVRRAGKSPVFRQPGEFQTVRTRRTAPRKARPAEPDWSRLAAPLPEVVKPPVKQEGPAPVLDKTSSSPAEEQNPAASACETSPTPSPEPAWPVYRLAFETWPLKNGLRFLLDSFCPAHRNDEEWLLYQSLAPGEIQPGDLRDLAALLRERCGGEVGFARQGALMKRVRLALVLAADYRLSLPELARATGYPVSGLQGRIKGKAAPWVEIIRNEEGSLPGFPLCLK